MVILRKKFTWSNLLGLLFKGSLVWYANCIALYMASSNHHVLGLENSLVQKFGLRHSETNHLVFYYHTSLGKCVYLLVYVDDIIITGNDATLLEYLI